MSNRIALALVTVTAVIALAGCSRAAAPARRAVAPRAQTAVADARLAVPSDEATPAGDPWRLVQEKCTVCHLLDRVTKARKDWAGWNTALDHMAQTGVPLSAGEKRVIAAYLARRK